MIIYKTALSYINLSDPTRFEEAMEKASEDKKDGSKEYTHRKWWSQ